MESISLAGLTLSLRAGMTEPQAVASYAQIMGVRPSITLEEIVQ